MKRVLCHSLPTPQRAAELGPEESKHAVQVLRLATGAPVLAMDGAGREALCTLRVSGKRATAEFKEAGRALPRPKPELILEAGILKADAMSWLIEKAVELGAAAVVPVESEYVVVRTKEKGAETFRERWQRIADQTLKQCGRLWRVEIAPPTPLEVLIAAPVVAGREVRFFLDEREDPSAGEALLLSRVLALNLTEVSSIRLLVGPEGGWGERDRSLLATAPGHWIPAHLGDAVLRAETAGLAALTQANAVRQRCFLDKKAWPG